MIRNQPPSPEQVVRIELMKAGFEKMEQHLLLVANNRERSLALTNLEQASMWATKAILENKS